MEAYFSSTDISLAENSFLLKLKTYSGTKEQSFDPLGIILHVQKDHPVIGKPPNTTVRSHSAITWESELSQDCGLLIGCIKISAYDIRQTFLGNYSVCLFVCSVLELTQSVWRHTAL